MAVLLQQPVSGKKPQFVLGTYPATTLAEAKNRHLDARALVKAGRDPAIEAAQALAARAAALAAAIVAPAQTVRDVFDEWKRDALKCVRKEVVRADGAKVNVKVAGYNDDGKYLEEQFGKHVFPRWGDMPIRECRQPMVLKLINDTRAQGKLSTAGHLFTNLHSFF